MTNAEGHADRLPHAMAPLLPASAAVPARFLHTHALLWSPTDSLLSDTAHLLHGKGTLMVHAEVATIADLETAALFPCAYPLHMGQNA
jgi:hypothetical protein